MKKNIIFIVVALVLAAGLGAIALFLPSPTAPPAAPAPAGGPSGAPAAPAPTETPTRVVRGAAGETLLKIFEIIATPQGYIPAEILLAKGDAVQLNVVARGGYADLTIPALGASIEVPDGGSRSLSIRVDAAGEFRFVCRIYCPEGREISGKLIVR